MQAIHSLSLDICVIYINVIRWNFVPFMGDDLCGGVSGVSPLENCLLMYKLEVDR